jgi:hypothetical protein
MKSFNTGTLLGVVLVYTKCCVTCTTGLNSKLGHLLLLIIRLESESCHSLLRYVISVFVTNAMQKVSISLIISVCYVLM